MATMYGMALRSQSDAIQRISDAADEVDSAKQGRMADTDKLAVAENELRAVVQAGPRPRRLMAIHRRRPRNQTRSGIPTLPSPIRGHRCPSNRSPHKVAALSHNTVGPITTLR
jgi:hypothetical protein